MLKGIFYGSYPFSVYQEKKSRPAGISSSWIIGNRVGFYIQGPLKEDTGNHLAPTLMNSKSQGAILILLLFGLVISNCTKTYW